MPKQIEDAYFDYLRAKYSSRSDLVRVEQLYNRFRKLVKGYWDVNTTFITIDLTKNGQIHSSNKMGRAAAR